MGNSPEDFLFNHELKINRIVSRIYFGMCAIPALIHLMTILGYYNYPRNLGVIAISVTFFMGFAMLVLEKTRLLAHSFKYFMVTSIQFIVFLYSLDYNIQITALYLLTPMFALLYFNPGLTIYASVLATLSMVMGIIISAPHAGPELWHVEPLQYIFTTGSGRLVEMIAASSILISASEIARKMMIKLKSGTDKISAMQSGLVYSFADMIESRDGTTGEHVKRTSQTVEYITKYILEHPEICNYELDKTDYELISMAAPLHDIGKMKVPDAILSKPGKLTPEEYEIIKTHSESGAKIIDRTMSNIEDPVYIGYAREMALSHHEKWNGEGYPQGLKGEEIPVSARIMAVADVFDALCSERSYKKAFTIDEAYDILRENSGTHFEPSLVEVMLNIRSDLEKIYGKKND